MTERFTPSELVYLFVDGEASTAERTEMYTALAGDSDLQAEFEDALRLKQTVDDEIATVIPPLNATKELFLRAGFAVPVPIAGGEAIAPAVSHIAEGGWLASLKSLMMPFLATTGIVTSAIVNMPFFDRIDTRNTHLHAELSSTNPTGDLHTNTTIFEAPFGFGDLTGSATNTNVSATRTHRRASRAAEPHQPAARMPGVGIIPNDKQQPPAAVENEAVPAEVATITVAEAHEESVDRSVAEPMRERSSLSELQHVTQPSKNNLWFGGSGIAGLVLFPSRGAEGATNVTINNIAASAEYEVAPGERIGIAAGSETFPHYVVNADTISTQKWNIIWAGATYSIAVSDLALGPFVPVFGTLLGGTGTGPLAKLSAGFSWQPDDRVRFGAGLESTALLYHYGSHLRTAGKLGFNYTVTVKF